MVLVPRLNGAAITKPSPGGLALFPGLGGRGLGMRLLEA